MKKLTFTENKLMKSIQPPIEVKAGMFATLTHEELMKTAKFTPFKTGNGIFSDGKMGL